MNYLEDQNQKGAVEVLAPLPARGAGLHPADRELWLGPVPVGCARNGLMVELGTAKLHLETVRAVLLGVGDANALRAANALTETIRTISTVGQCLQPEEGY